MKKILVASVVAAMTIAMGGIAWAVGTGTQTASITASASSVANCSISSATNIAFGNYDPTSGTDNTAGSGAVTFTCTNGVVYAVYITPTTNGSTPRYQMTDGGTNTLDYEIYADSGRTTLFPNAQDTTVGSPWTGTAGGLGSPVTVNYYGTIPAGQDVAAPVAYTETLTVNVDY